MGTMRRWRYNALPQWHAIDADIQEASHNRAENEKHCRPKVKRHRGPNPRIKHITQHAITSACSACESFVVSAG